MTSQQRHRPGSLYLLALCSLAFTACVPSDAPDDPQEPPFVVRYTSERLEIGTDFDAKLCRGQFDLWEDQIDAIELHLGLSRESAWVYLYNDFEAIAQACHNDNSMAYVAGCWSGTVIYSEIKTVAHELVHAWAMSANPDPLPVLREGLAVRMSGPVSRPNGTYTVSGLLVTEVPPFEYSRASHFVAWLMDTYGTDRFMDLYARTSRGSSAKALDAAARAALGSDIEEVLAAYDNALPTYYPGMGAQACGAAAKVPWQGEAATWEAITECDDGPLIGFEGGPWQRVVLDVPSDGVYVLDTVGPAAAMTHCLTVPTEEAALEPSNSLVADDWKYSEPLESWIFPYGWDYDEVWADQLLDLRAGTYEIWINNPGQMNLFDEPMSLRRM